MPWYQTAGIVLAAVVALLSLPKLVGELTLTGRMHRRVERQYAVVEKVQDERAKSALQKIGDGLALKLAASQVIRPSIRDYVAAIEAVVVTVVFFVAWTSDWPDSSWMKFVLSAAIYVVTLAVQTVMVTRLETLKLNRELYAALGAPSDLQLVAIPKLRDYYLKPTVTCALVMEVSRKAKAKAESEPGAGRYRLLEYVNKAIELMERDYRPHGPVTR